MDNRQQRRLAAKARAQEIQSHMNAARNAMRSGDAVAAERECQAALGVDPLAAEPHHLLAHIAYGQGRLQNAGDHILEAATRDDGNLDIHSDDSCHMHLFAGLTLDLYADFDADLTQVMDAPSGPVSNKYIQNQEVVSYR